MLLIRRLVVAVVISLTAFVGAAPRAFATVNSATNKTIVLGNGSQTQFAFNFVGVASAYVSVILTDSAGNETLLSQGSGASQYTIVLNAPVQGAIWGMGGTVTYNPLGTPIPAGSTLTIARTLPLVQSITLANQSSIATLGKGAESGLDTGVMQSQQINEVLARAIVAPIVDATPPLPLPPIAQRANQGAAFDGAGNLVPGVTPASGIISAAMQPVVNAATLALGRTAFGLGAMAQEGIGAGLQDDGAGNARVNSTLTSVAVNQNVDTTFAEKTLIGTGPVNFNLARANTLWNGFAFTVFVLSAPVTLIPNANDSIQGQASGVNVAIPANSVAVVTTDGAASGNWRITWSPWSVIGAPKSMALPLVAGNGIAITGAMNNTIAQSLTNATLQANPVNPAGTPSNVGVMMGLGSTCKLTPVYSGRIKLEFYGSASNPVALTFIISKTYFGTGAPPVNTSGITGTQVGNAFSIHAPGAAISAPFSNGGIITGLTPGTAYWFDVSLATGTNTATLTSLSCNAMEF